MRDRVWGCVSETGEERVRKSEREREREGTREREKETDRENHPHVIEQST